MRSLPLLGLGIGFMLMGLGLFALSFRKAKPTPALPTKTQLREQDELSQETKKLRLAAGAVLGFGAVLFVMALLR